MMYIPEIFLLMHIHTQTQLHNSYTNIYTTMLNDGCTAN